MKTSLTKRLLAMLLVLCLVIPMAPTFTLPARAAETDPVIVVAGSDFQANTHELSAANVTALLNSVKTNGGYGSIDGFLFAGDYTNAWTVAEATNGLSALKGAVNAVYPGAADSKNAIYIQGNHDSTPMVGDSLADTGAHDADAYGVYVINEDDLAWHNDGSAAKAEATAAGLSSYLEAKIRVGYNKPIFVVSHIPLHHTMRTELYGDGQYANYVFDVLNRAGQIGLNIIYMFGHHHSNSWLDSQGGSALFYTRGDKLNISQGSWTEYQEETLNFTYMNAGFVGYYSTPNTGVPSKLNMSVFEIDGNDVKISRYTTDGIHVLKSAGVENTAQTESWLVDTTVVTAPKTLYPKVLAATGDGITLYAPNITGVQVTLLPSEGQGEYSVYHTYEITGTAYTQGTTAVISVPVDYEFDATRPVLVIDSQNDTVSRCEIIGGRVVFQTDHDGEFVLAQSGTTYTATGAVPEYTPIPVTALEPGNYYVIKAYLDDFMLSGNTISNSVGYDSLELEAVPIRSGQLWYYELKDNGSYYLRCGDRSDGYITLTNNSCFLVDVDTYASYDRCKLNVYLNNDGETFSIDRATNNTDCLHQYDGKGTYCAAAGWYDGNTAGDHAKWYFYTLDDGEVNVYVDASKTSMTVGQTATMHPHVTLEGEDAESYTLTWSVENPGIAMVDNTGVVKALGLGKTNIVATVTKVNGYDTAEDIQCKIPLNVYPESAGTLVNGVTVDGVDAYAYYAASDCPDSFTCYYSYDITPVGYTEGTEATVSIPVESGIDRSRSVFVIDHEERKTLQAEIVDGFVTFTTDHFSVFTVAQMEETVVTGYYTGQLNLAMATANGEGMTPGIPYLITDNAAGSAQDWMLTGETATKTGAGTGLLVEPDIDPNTSHVWYVDADGYLRYLSSNGKYVQLGTSDTSVDVSLSSTRDDRFSAHHYLMGSTSRQVYFGRADDEKAHLNRNGGGTALTNNVALVFTKNAPSHSGWYVHKLVTGIKVTAQVSTSQTVMNLDGSIQLKADALLDASKASMEVPESYLNVTDVEIEWTSLNTDVVTVDENGLVSPVAMGQAYVRAEIKSVNGVAVQGMVLADILITVEDVTVSNNVITSTTHYGYRIGNTVKFDTDNLTPGGPYVIGLYFGNGYLSNNYLTPEDSDFRSTESRPGLEMLTNYDPLNPPLWYLDEVGLNFGGNTNQYLVRTASGVTLGSNTEGNYVYTVVPCAYGKDNAWNIYDLKAVSYPSDSYLQVAGGFPSGNVASYTSGHNKYWQLKEVLPDRVVAFSASPAEEKVFLGSSLRMNPKVTVDGSKISDYTIQWFSVDNSIATVNADGIVSTVAEGKTYIVGYLTHIDGEELNAPLFVEAVIEVISEEETLTSFSGQSEATLLPVTDIQDGVAYIMTSNLNGSLDMVVTNIDGATSTCDPAYTGLKLQHFNEVGNAHTWYFETDSDTGRRYLRYGDPANSQTDETNYLIAMSANEAGLGRKNHNTFITWEAFDNGLSYRPVALQQYNGRNQYFHQLGGWSYDVAVTAVYTDAGSRWRFNTCYESKDYTFSVSPESVELNLTETVELLPKLIFGNIDKNRGNFSVTYTSSDPTVAAVRSGKIVPLKGGEVTVKVTLTQVIHDGLTHTIEDAVLYVPVTVHGVQSVTVNNLEGKLPIRASESLKVSAMNEELADPTLTVTYTNGATSTTPLIGSYMTDSSGNRISTQSAATYENVRITYVGVRATNNFTLHIVKRDEPDYPTYPEPGSVQLNKGTIDSQNFQTSGITQVELGVNGVPSKKGADVIVMLDTSSSMGNKTVNNEYRLYALTDSLNQLIESLKQVQADGTLMDVRMAVADFNGNYTDESSPYYVTDYDVVNDAAARRYNTTNAVFTGDKTLSAGAFMNVRDMAENPFYARDYDIKDESGNVIGQDHYADRYPTSKQYYLGVHSGTNYDYAFDAVYQLGQAINDANALAGEERDLYVIFMSDGAPFQYNYFTSYSGSTSWTNWLLGTMEDSMYGANATKEYYNPRGEHWMAEAIMGDPAETYPVIRKNDYRDHDGDNFIDVAGLGATMYSLGFCLKNDGQITTDTMKTLLGKLASSEEEYVFFPNSSSELTGAFDKIFADIQYAATDAYVVDTIGEKFDLLLGDHSYWQNQETVTFTGNRIQIRNYEIYTITDNQLGNCEVTQIGARKTNDDGSYKYTVSETVTFKADGTEAYSDQIDGGNTNILIDGVICAKNFWYNTNLTPVEIDFNGNGTIDNGETLDAETFYWKVGTITLTETVLNYYVELVGALDAEVAAGIYETNKSASLYYENYLGEDCDQVAPVPSVPWRNAQVGYGFYLVNKQGVPIVNKETGMTGSFDQSIKSVVLTDTVYQEFNTGATVSLVANRLFPRELLSGYRLFDDEARYDVTLDADGTGSISVYTNGVVPLSTYITGLTESSVLTGDAAGMPLATTNFANANTVVWFAVTVADDAMTVDKTVEKAEGENKYTLTLESYSTGTQLELPSSKPADIVLVLDQSSTMYTPVGIDSDRISIDNLATVRQQLNGKEIAFNADNETIQENAKNLGYYIAIHNSSNYIYIVQYAQNEAGKWGWYYVPVDQTVRTVEVDTENATNNTDTALNMGKVNGTYQPYGYGTYSQTDYNNAALPTSLVTYYQSQYGAMYDTLQEFVKNLKEESVCSGLNHRVAVVGFASPFYDGWTGYDGTGIYVDGDYYLYDSDYKYVKDGVTYDPDKVFSSGTDNYSASSVLGSDKRHEFNVSDDTYASALVSLRDNYQSVLNSVKAYKANYQQTSPAIGITIAQSIFAARKSTANLFTEPTGLADKLNPAAPDYDANNGHYYQEDQEDEHLKSTYTKDNDEDREEIIILFTDGVPTVRCTSDRDMGSRKMNNNADTHPVSHEFWSINGGIDDVIDHAYEAKQAGIQIYGIATSKTLMGQYGDFFKHVTSDDPTAKSTLTVSENWVKDSAGEYFLKSASTSFEITNSTYTDKGYTQYANGADVDLSEVFRTVYESIDATVELGRDAVLKDVISDYFDLSATGTASIKVYTAKYDGVDTNGNYKFKTPVLYNDAVVEVNNGVISVSNFDYRGQYIGTYGGVNRGSKLIVQVEIVPKDGFWGGNNVPTNKSDSAIYTPDGTAVVSFPIPEANVTPEIIVTPQNQVTYYKEPTLDTLVDLTKSITVDGVAVTMDDIGNLTPSEPWMDDYADLFWKGNKDLVNNVSNSVTNLQSGRYGFSVVMVPKADMTGQSNTTGKSNIAGTPISADGIASDKVYASVELLVPLVTLKDSTVRIGDEISGTYLETNHLVTKDGKQFQWINMSDIYGTEGKSTTATMGTEPTITLSYETTYTIDNRVIQDDPVTVQVSCTNANGKTQITSASYFEWIPCDTEHEDGQTIVDEVAGDAFHRHKGNVDSYEFVIHVTPLQTDTVVIDFGLPVDIDVLTNDDLPEGCTLQGAKTEALSVSHSDAHDSKISDSVAGDHGTLTKVDSKLRYTPTDMQLDDSVDFTYEVQFKFNYTDNNEEQEATHYYYSTVTVIPATTIYYEDNAVSVTYHTESDYENLAQWETVPEGATASGTQDQDRPGYTDLEDLDAESIYGFDNAYTGNTTYSNGSAHWVEVYRHDVPTDGDECSCGVSKYHNWLDVKNDGICDRCGSLNGHHCADANSDGNCDTCSGTMEHTCADTNRSGHCNVCGKLMGTHSANARATFTFTGTGFDVISLCNNTTGIVMVSVYKGTVTDFDNPPYDDYVTSFMVDTYYGYKYENGEWIQSAGSDTLYQVPVIKADLTDYGTYSVEIYVAPSFISSEHAYNSSLFYLDAIRIYNPAGASGTESDVVQNAYKEDKEGWPEYTELRNMIIGRDSLNESTQNGVIFIDGKTMDGSADYQISDYISYGPNNEVYLGKNQSIAFKLSKSDDAVQNVASVQLGVRGLTGAGKFRVDFIDSEGNSDLMLTASVGTTDMYYGLSRKNTDGTLKIFDKVVLITNTGSKPISITNIKVTYKSAPQSNFGFRTLPEVDNTVGNLALGVLNAQQLSDPVVTPKYPALSFDGMVCYNVFFTAEELGELTSADLGLAVFDSEDTEGTVETAKDVIMGATEVDGLYMVTTNGVHAKYLGDKQYFRAFAKKADGSYVYSQMVSYSALDYATGVLEKSDDVTLKRLVVAMLNYGAEAQKFFGYKTDDLMNKDLTADEQALLAGYDASSLNAVGKVDASKVGSFASTGGFTKRYPAISFKGAFEINYFMAPANAVDGEMTLYVWNEDTYNSVTELTAENADKAVAMTLENGIYTASSDEIAAKYLDKTVYVAAVYESNGEIYCSGVLPYSIAAYCQKPPADVADLATAAAIYGCTAKEYFGA